MPRMIKVGYDRYPEYSEDEIKKLYLAEGKPEDQAVKLAKAFYVSQLAMIADERYRWRKAWKLQGELPEPKPKSEESDD
jgi:hypothetical protein